MPEEQPLNEATPVPTVIPAVSSMENADTARLPWQIQEEVYQRMISEIQDYAIVLLDIHGTILNWNKGAENIKGYSHDEIVGKNFSNFYFEEDRLSGLPQRLLEQARTMGRATHEGWRRRKDGSGFWGSIVITAFHNEAGDVIGFSKVTRDLTERKNAEDRLRDYTSRLEFQNRELEQFAYAASHDMREPLRKISFYTKYIAEHGANGLDDKSRDYLNRTLNATQRMSALVEDLLTYSHTESAVGNFEPTDLNRVVDEVFSTHKDLVEQQVMAFSRDELPVVNAVPFQMKQLFDNLVNNSVQHRHPGRPGSVHISSERCVIASHLTDAGAPAVFDRISVSDNGVGFEQQFAEKIFELFQRLTSPTGIRGSGIGLAICKRIVQNHNGRIEAFGTPGQGARFDVYLPPSDDC